MSKEMSKIKFLDCLSFDEYPRLKDVRKRYPGIPVFPTPDGWALFRSLDDFYAWLDNKRK